MHFQGPAAADLANVEALNHAFLGVLSRLGGVPGGTTPGAGVLADKLAALPPEQRLRLAESPFLIFSLSESNDDRWQQIFARDDVDLVDRMQRPPEALAQLAAASLGFLWELSKRNPYAARLVSGAPLHWCERLAECTPLKLFQVAAYEPDLLVPRFSGQRGFWSKLLGAGVHEDAAIRGAAQLCAMQSLLTRQDTRQYQPLAAAACSMPAPAMRVAERRQTADDP